MQQFIQHVNSLVSTPFLTIGNTSISVGAIAQFLFVFLVALGVSLALRRILAHQILGRLGLKQGTRESIAAIASYTVGILCVIALLQAIGINLASLAVVAGSLGIGIGFGLQDLTKNFISGLTLLIEQKLKVGDFIELEGVTGYVMEISLRSTVIRTITQRHVVVPNSYLVSNQVVNWTYNNTQGWVSVVVRVVHESDPLLVIQLLLDSASIEETVSYDYPPEVLFTSIEDNALVFTLWVWSHRIDLRHLTESSLRFIIEHNLRQNGIRLASPRLDLWQRSPTVVVRSPSSPTDQATLPTLEDRVFNPPNNAYALRDLLRHIPYLQVCTELEIRKLIEVGYRHYLKPGQVLYREGDPGNAFYIILSGSVGYTITGLDQPPVVLKAGQFVGEFSLMLNVPRTVTVRALEETTLFAISPPGFKKLLRTQPHLYDLIVQEMGKHRDELSQQGRKLRELGLLNPDEYDTNPVAWVRKQLEKLFGTS